MSFGSLFSLWRLEERVLRKCSNHGATVLPISVQPRADVSCWSWHMVFWRAWMFPQNISYHPLQVCKVPLPVSCHWHRMEPWAQHLCCDSPAPRVGFSSIFHQLPLTQNSHSYFAFSSPDHELQACGNAFIFHKQIIPSVGLFFI